MSGYDRPTMGSRSRSIVVSVAVGLCASALPAGAPAAPVGVLDLRTDFDARIDGPQDSAGAGRDTARAGDVNGDGRDDLLVRSILAPLGPHRVYVVFGRTDWQDLDLASFGPQDGFVIDGTRNCCGAASLAAAGDVNGDGLDDVIIGSPVGLSPGPVGSAYVVFGKTSTEPVHVDTLGAAGFRIAGVSNEDLTGFAVSGAGHVNGDGLDDVVLTGPGRRSAFVVFGKVSTSTVQLASLGAAGFRITPPIESFRGVAAVAGTGDTNGDGRGDVMLGVPGAGTNGNGRVFVVFGKSGSADVDGSALGEGGYVIENSFNHVSAGAGQALAGGGDMNGDGRTELLIGAPGADHNVGGSGSVYVVFGQAQALNLDLTSYTNGFRIDGKGVLHAAGSSVAGGGDVNGDGRPDIIVGEPEGEFQNDRWQAGSAYIVFGKASLANVRLGGLNPGQVEIAGVDPQDRAGTSVALGAFGGDARADVLVGAPGTDDARIDAGTVYVLLRPLLPRALTLAPVQATNSIGDEHCVTAHAVDAIGAPLPGFDVRFDVTGVNTTSGTSQAGSGGDAQFCYTGRLATGSDRITAYADGNGNGVQDPGEPDAAAAKEWIVPQSTPDCAVSFHGQITTAAGGKATLDGRAESAGAEASGRHSYLDRAASLRVRSRDVAALVCSGDGRGASLFGEARSKEGRVSYRIELGADARNRGSYRIRLDTGYDSGQRTLRGSLRITSP